MNRRKNFHENVIVQSFFQLLEREQIQRKIFS